MGSELIMPAQSEAEQHVKIRLKAGAGGIPTVFVQYRVDERKCLSTHHHAPVVPSNNC